MDQKIFQEAFSLYNSTLTRAHILRAGIKLRDEIVPEILDNAVKKCMERYPYFCVELKKKDGKWILAENRKPVVVNNSENIVTLGSEEANGHMIAFSYNGNWINIGMSHAVTDGTGIYEVFRTLLYYYCSERYDKHLSTEGIRLAGDTISDEEWEQPLPKLKDIKPKNPEKVAPALCLVDESQLSISRHHRSWDITIDEEEFMKFVSENGGTPSTMTAVLLSRAIDSQHPQSRTIDSVHSLSRAIDSVHSLSRAIDSQHSLSRAIDSQHPQSRTIDSEHSLSRAIDSQHSLSRKPIKIFLAMNLRRALNVPLAHQTLVGGVILEYKPELRDRSIKEQVAEYRSLVSVQTKRENVIAIAAEQKAMLEAILAQPTDEARKTFAGKMAEMSDSSITAGVSYVGKANLGEAEKYVIDFRTYTNSIGKTPIVEISAVNGRFMINFIQPFEDDRYIKAFLGELESNHISYSLLDEVEVKLPGLSLPWN